MFKVWKVRVRIRVMHSPVVDYWYVKSESEIGETVTVRCGKIYSTYPVLYGNDNADFNAA